MVAKKLLTQGEIEAFYTFRVFGGYKVSADKADSPFGNSDFFAGWNPRLHIDKINDIQPVNNQLTIYK